MAEQPPQNSKAPKKKKSGFRIVHQRLVLEVDFASQRLVGYTEIVVAPLAGTLSRVSLNWCPELQIHRVFVNNVETRIKLNSAKGFETPTRSLESYWALLDQEQDISENGELIIGVPNDLRVQVQEGEESRAEPLVVRIVYELSYPSQGVQFVVPNPQFPCRTTQVFTTHARGPVQWFPCKDSLSERCTFDFQLTCPSGMTAIASGRLKDKSYVDASQEKTTFTFSCEIPITARGFGFACGLFQAIPGNDDVTHFVSTSANRAHAQSALVADTAAVFQIYEECLSSSFPYDSYKQVFVDDAYSNTMSFAGLSILSSSLLYGPSVIDQVFTTRYCLAFALAESWTSSIFLSSVADLWVLDGIARYLASLYVQSSLGSNESEYDRMIECIYVSETDTCGDTTPVEGSIMWRDRNCELVVGDELTTACLTEERIARGTATSGVLSALKMDVTVDASVMLGEKSSSTAGKPVTEESKLEDETRRADYCSPCRPLSWNGYCHPTEMYDSLMSRKAGVVFKMMQNITNATNFRKIIGRVFEESGYHVQYCWQFGRPWRLVESIPVVGYVDEIPTCLVRMRDFLEKTGGLDTPGIFSVVASASSAADSSAACELQTLKAELNWDAPNFTCDNPHYIAQLMKQWLNELQPSHLLDEVDINEVQQSSTAPELAFELLQKLSGRTILEWLLDLGVEVTSREAVNKMSPLRWAQGIAPVLIEAQADWNTTKHHNAIVVEFLLNAMKTRKGSLDASVVPQKTQKSRVVEQLTTKGFLKLAKAISNETQAIDSFAQLWIKCDGYPLMKAQFRFHHKKKETEIQIEQEHPHGIRFSGHLLFRIHEEDRAWEAVKRIDEDKVDNFFPCSSRLRRNRKRKVVDDLTTLELDELLQRFIGTPVLWVRVDPYYMWFRPFIVDMGGTSEPLSGERLKLAMQECEVMWILQLTKERDVVAQCEAIQGLARMSHHGSTLLSFSALQKTLEDSKRVFHRVRSMAAFGLATSCLRNAKSRAEEVGDIVGRMLDYFYLKNFEQHNKAILKPNNFVDFAEYMMKKSMCFALSLVRVDGLTPRKVVELLLVLLQNNDNSKNSFTDSFYLFVVIRAVGNLRLSDSLLEGQVWSQLKRYLDFDRVVPSFQNLVTQAVLEAACRFELADQLSPEHRIDFTHFLQRGNFAAVRATAFRCLAALLPLRPQLFSVLLSAVESEETSVNFVQNTSFARGWALGSSVEHADVSLQSVVSESEPLPLGLSPQAPADVFCIALPGMPGFSCNLSSPLEFPHGGCMVSSLTLYARTEVVMGGAANGHALVGPAGAMAAVSIKPVLQFFDSEDKIKESDNIACQACAVSPTWTRLRWALTLRNVHMRGSLKFVIHCNTGRAVRLLLCASQLEPKAHPTPFFLGSRSGCQGVRLRYAEIWAASTTRLCKLMEPFRVPSLTNHDYMLRLWTLLTEAPDMSFRCQLQRLYRALWGSKTPSVASFDEQQAKPHVLAPEESAAQKRRVRAALDLRRLRSSRKPTSEDNKLVFHRGQLEGGSEEKG